MKRGIKTLLQWEVEETYRFPTLEAIVGILITVLLVLSKPIFPLSALQLYAPQRLIIYSAMILDVILPIGMLFLAVLLTNTLAGAYERRDTQLLLSYPVSRKQALLMKLIPTFGVFFLTFMAGVIILVGQLAPFTLTHYLFWILVLGLAFYLLFFISAIACFAIVSRNLKISLITSILFVFGFFYGVNPRVMRFPPGFLTTLVTDFVDVFWEGSSHHSSINVPFFPVLLSHILLTLVFFTILYLYYTRFMEV